MINPVEITKRLNEKSNQFINKPFMELVIGGILAGAFVGIAALTSMTVCSDMKGYFGEGITKLVSGIVFSLGLILIVLSGSELFTGSNLYITSTFNNKKNIPNLLKNWSIVYISNFVGSIILLYAVIASGAFDYPGIHNYLMSIVQIKLNLTFLQAFMRGILCNFLVCLAVRVGEASENVSGKILGFIYVISSFVINSFEHSIANMFFIPAGIITGGKVGIYISWKTFLLKNLIPVTLGNILGGALFVATAYFYMHKNKLNIPLERAGEDTCKLQG